MIIESRNLLSYRSRWIERGRSSQPLQPFLGYDSDTNANVIVFDASGEVRYRVSLTGDDIERAYAYMLRYANESGVAFRRSIRRMVAGDL